MNPTEVASIVEWLQGGRNGAVAGLPRVEDGAADADETGCVRRAGFVHSLSEVVKKSQPRSCQVSSNGAKAPGVKR